MVPTRQTIGDCVSHGWAQGVEILAAVEIDKRGEREQWKGRIATEAIYGSARVEIGGGRLSSDGCMGSWAAKAVKEMGVVARGKYGNVDLRNYSGKKAREWGRRGRGVPDSLEPTMREHLVRSVSLITSYEDARDSIVNGYPLPVCSGRGFRSTRDSQGFASPSGSW